MRQPLIPILPHVPAVYVGARSGLRLCSIPCSILLILVFLYLQYTVRTSESYLSAVLDVMLRTFDFCFVVICLPKLLFIDPFIPLYF
jgi:hypothetical protein